MTHLVSENMRFLSARHRAFYGYGKRGRFTETAGFNAYGFGEAERFTGRGKLIFDTSLIAYNFESLRP